MYYVYVIKSLVNEFVYIGLTNDLRRRVSEHNRGNDTSTKPYRPFTLVYYEAYRSNHDASVREKHLKHYGAALGHLKKRIVYSLGIKRAGEAELSDGD